MRFQVLSEKNALLSPAIKRPWNLTLRAIECEERRFGDRNSKDYNKIMKRFLGSTLEKTFAKWFSEKTQSGDQPNPNGRACIPCWQLRLVLSPTQIGRHRMDSCRCADERRCSSGDEMASALRSRPVVGRRPNAEMHGNAEESIRQVQEVKKTK
jgi:hypothetical protein